MEYPHKSEHSATPNFIQPYEQMNSSIDFLEFPKKSVLADDFVEIHRREPSHPDINLVAQDELHLIRQRIENLREKIGLSFDEILELQELEGVTKVFEDDIEAIPGSLGIPGKIDQLLSALEAKRVNRYDNEKYDGGDMDDDPVSSVNQYYKELLKESFLNVKSIRILNRDKQLISPQNGRKKEVVIFDLYEIAPAKLSFSKFLARLWKTTETEAMERLRKESGVTQWELKIQWQNYLKERENKTPSPLHRVLLRCHDLVASPIYDGMEEIKEEHYNLKRHIEFRFTDKTAIFTIPISEFSDIPLKKALAEVKFLQAAFTLPKYAHEKKRFFRKGGTVKELATFLDRLSVSLLEKQIKFLDDLVSSGVLRLYREVLELPERDEIRGYFLNVRSGFQNFSKGYIVRCIRERFNQEEKIITRGVCPQSTWYPEWMRKIGGFIVEEIHGNSVSFPKPTRVSVDNRLPRYAFKHERLLMPSYRLITTNNTGREKWQKFFTEELRRSYRRNPQAFKQYALAIETGKAELHCSCNNNGTHEKYCPVPVLTEILGKVAQAMDWRQNMPQK